MAYRSTSTETGSRSPALPARLRRAALCAGAACYGDELRRSRVLLAEILCVLGGNRAVRPEACHGSHTTGRPAV